MSTVSLRDLARHTGSVIDEVVQSGKPALVTKRGRPVAVVINVEDEAFEDYILAHAPEFVEGRREADEELARGETKSLSSYIAELSDPEHPK